MQKELREKAITSRKQVMEEIAVRSSRLIEKYRNTGSKTAEFAIRGNQPETTREIFSSPERKTIVTDKELIDQQSKLDSIKTKIKELKQEEMSRVSHEFITNDYERKFGISQKVVVAALIGEDIAKLEYERQLKDKVDYMRRHANQTTFRFGGLSSKSSLVSKPMTVL